MRTTKRQIMRLFNWHTGQLSYTYALASSLLANSVLRNNRLHPAIRSQSLRINRMNAEFWQRNKQALESAYIEQTSQKPDPKMFSKRDLREYQLMLNWLQKRINL